MNEFPKISVPIVCSNNEDTIGAVLESIKDIAFEIIVIIDTKSTDKTLEIVKKYTNQFFVEEWRGFLNQKNEALKRCAGDWVLSLDSDEVVSPELKNEIKKAVMNEYINGFYLNRRTVYLGKVMNYVWQPDYRLRLCKRSQEIKWVGESIHEVLFVSGKTSRLKGLVFHYSYNGITDHFQRTLQYARGVAQNRHNAGKKFSILKAVIAPPLDFIKQYFIKRGFLDGFRGLVAAVSSSLYSFMKQVYLWEIEWQKMSSKK